MREESRRSGGRAAGGAAVLAAAVLLGAGLVPAPSEAQVSPGALSRAHTHLEGIRNCLECHARGQKSVDERCLDCHREIRWSRDEGRGLHHHTAVGECARCHPEHGGLEMNIVRWKDNRRAEDFDHTEAGWELTGRHDGVKCRDCHRPAHQVSPAMALRPGGTPEKSWLGLETSCVSCHDDPHEGRLGTSCADCHTTADFTEILEDGFDHDRTAYPLRGAHARVDCASCHETTGGWSRPAFASCTDCHADPHDGAAALAGAPADCAACHDVNAFAPSTLTVSDHARTAYPLEGAHRTVACGECHGRGTERRDGRTRARFRFRPAASDCRSCHDNAHGTQLAGRADGGACEACHTVEHFRPSRFTVAAHAKTDFPLHGRHAETECASCHGPRRPGGNDVPAGAEFGSARVMFRFTSTDCASCHSDPHGGAFGAAPKGGNGADGATEGGCLTCHGYDSFHTSSVGIAMHAGFAFPLDGAHGSVPCFECHRELLRKPARSTLRGAAPARELTFRKEHASCRDCHADPHGAQFRDAPSGGKCVACHTADAFAPAARFDHDRDARFPLEGRHAEVACAGCHTRGARADGTEGVIYRPVAHRCEDCHAVIPMEGSGQ